MGVPTYILSKSNVNFSYRSREYRVVSCYLQPGNWGRRVNSSFETASPWVKWFDTSQRFNYLFKPQQGHKILCQLLLLNDVLMDERPS